MLNKERYQDIITEVSEHIATKIINEEQYLAQRATGIDQDIQTILQEVGRQTTQNVLEETRDKLVLKKKWMA